MAVGGGDLYLNKNGIYYEGDRQYSVINGELSWDDEVDKRIFTIDEKIIKIEELYTVKFDSLQKRLNAVLLSDGIDQETKTIILQNEYKELSTQKDLEILSLLGGIE